jgi:Ran GTPase-activating protein (RanGAP) involved in mRNA processing and transport
MTKITLTASGPRRTRVHLAEAEEILARFQETVSQHANDAGDDDDCKASVQVHTLNLSRRPWPLESLYVFTFVLEAIASQVVIFKLDNIITDLKTDDGLASLAFLANMFSSNFTDKSCIQEIDLSDNALGTRGVVVLKPLLRWNSLQRLYFNNCELSAESFSETLLPILHMNAPNWTALNLGCNQLGPASAGQVGQLLERCIHLESFIYAGNRPQAEGTRHICQGLADMTVAATAAANSQTPMCSLQILDLSACTFRSGDEDVGSCLALCQCLRASPALRKLVLRNVKLEVAGLQRVLHSVQLSGARLSFLNLGATGTMGEEGAAILQAYLEGSSGNGASSGAARHLQELSFDSNKLTDAGLADLVAPFTAKECCLRKLNLANNELEAAGVRILLDNSIPTLQELNLWNNPDIPIQQVIKLQAMYPLVPGNYWGEGDY